ncbi:MAG: hypothetical protein ACJ764_11345 [Solirubrobacteraceae bacterium]
MSSAAQLVLMVGGMHILGLACALALIIPALRDRPEPPQPPSDGSDGGGGLHRPSPDAPMRPRGGIPLPDAQPARIRLREPGRLADQRPGRERRPAREPVRSPTRVVR